MTRIVGAGPASGPYRCHRTTTYRIRIVNEHFAQDGEHEAADDIAAWQKAVHAAIMIGADQVSHGNPYFGAEVTVEAGDKRIGR